jgi:hypothetical protein
MKIAYKKIYYKENKRFILFRYFKDYRINEQDLSEVLRFNTLKEARNYLKFKGVIIEKLKGGNG